MRRHYDSCGLVDKLFTLLVAFILFEFLVGKYRVIKLISGESRSERGPSFTAEEKFKVTLDGVRRVTTG